MSGRFDSEDWSLQTRSSAWSHSPPSPTLWEPRGDSLFVSPVVDGAASWARDQPSLDLSTPRFQVPPSPAAVPPSPAAPQFASPRARRRPAALNVHGERNARAAASAAANAAANTTAMLAPRSPSPVSSKLRRASDIRGSRVRYYGALNVVSREELGRRAEGPDLSVLLATPRSKPIDIPKPSQHDQALNDFESPLPADLLEPDTALFKADW